MPNWLIGGDPTLFSDPNQGTITSNISQLSNSNFGQREAQSAIAASGRAFQQQEEDIKSNPSFGRNAAVTSALIDRAAQEQGTANAKAVTSGAMVDQQARMEAAKLGMVQSDQLMGENELNYQRQQDASFGNSFLGHLVSGVAGSGIGALTGGLGAGLAADITGVGTDKNGNPVRLPSAGSPMGDDLTGENQNIGDASFKKGEIKMLVGKDGTTYTPRPDDGVVVGTKLGGGANQLLAAGQITPQKSSFRPGLKSSFHEAKMGHSAFEFGAC